MKRTNESSHLHAEPIKRHLTFAPTAAQLLILKGQILTHI